MPEASASRSPLESRAALLMLQGEDRDEGWEQNGERAEDDWNLFEGVARAGLSEKVTVTQAERLQRPTELVGHP